MANFIHQSNFISIKLVHTSRVYKVAIKFVFDLLPIYNLIGAFKYNKKSFVAK
jgi:hypothetical protein